MKKYLSLSKPIIQPSYRGHLHANITNDYASITLLGVNRLDTGSYTLIISTYPNDEESISAVEISVLCKYKETLKTKLHKQR